MKRAIPLLVLILLMGVTGPIRAEPTNTVSWADVQKALTATICVVPTEPNSTQLDAIFGDRETCKSPKATTPTELAVDEIFSGPSRALFVSVPPGFSIEPDLKAALRAKELQRSNLAAIAYLADRDFRNTFLARLSFELTAHNLVCPDCPEAPKQDMRTVPWDQFAPYVVRSIQVVVKGDRVTFHPCSGVSAETISAADPGLARAGYLATFAGSVRNQVNEILGGAMEDPAYESLDPTERTNFLTLRLSEALPRDTKVVASVCQSLAPFVRELAIQVADCSTLRATRADNN